MIDAISPADLDEKLTSLYESGLPRGDSTGWLGLDEYFTVARGQWTLVTGIPSRGKSEFLDAMMINLVRMRDWRFIIFSPENQPHQLHAAKLIEKSIRMPFSQGPTERMSFANMVDGMIELSKFIRFLTCNSEFVETPSLNAIMHAAARVIEREWQGKKVGLIIDPWNELDHARPANLTETEYISRCLSGFRQFCRDWNIHGFLVAHPKILQKDRDGSTPVPRPYDVSGSAHWYNKADNCITVHRDLLNDPHMVDIHVQKVRFKHIGKPGIATLEYDRVTGTYADSSRYLYQTNGG